MLTGKISKLNKSHRRIVGFYFEIRRICNCLIKLSAVKKLSKRIFLDEMLRYFYSVSIKIY